MKCQLTPPQDARESRRRALCEECKTPVMHGRELRDVRASGPGDGYHPGRGMGTCDGYQVPGRGMGTCEGHGYL